MFCTIATKKLDLITIETLDKETGNTVKTNSKVSDNIQVFQSEGVELDYSTSAMYFSEYSLFLFKDAVDDLCDAEAVAIATGGIAVVSAVVDTCTYLDDIYLHGVYVDVDENNDDFEYILSSTGDDFLSKSKNIDYFEQDRFFCTVNCHGDESGKYNVFFGKEVTGRDKYKVSGIRHIPGGWYARFTYHGDMFDIRSTFVDDLYRWIMVKDIELSYNGIGMLNIFDKEYIENKYVNIFIPIKMYE